MKHYHTIILVLLTTLCGAGCATKHLQAPLTITTEKAPVNPSEWVGGRARLGSCVWLYIPESFSLPPDGTFTVTMHFHGPMEIAIDEHVRRRKSSPLLVYTGHQSSNQYLKDFEDGDLFRRIIKKIEAEVVKQTGTSKVRVASVEISSFSAGYGAVREILRYTQNSRLVDTIILADSLFAAFSDPENHAAGPLQEHMVPFMAFARDAVEGKKTMLITHSSFDPGIFASTTITAEAIVKGVGGKSRAVKEARLNLAETDKALPLVSFFERGNLYVWGYAGTDAGAHTAHLLSLADFWKVLDSRERQ